MNCECLVWKDSPWPVHCLHRSSAWWQRHDCRRRNALLKFTPLAFTCILSRLPARRQHDTIWYNMHLNQMGQWTHWNKPFIIHLNRQCLARFAHNIKSSNGNLPCQGAVAYWVLAQVDCLSVWEAKKWPKEFEEIEEIWSCIRSCYSHEGHKRIKEIEDPGDPVGQ
jgi:hypothetical protein